MINALQILNVHLDIIRALYFKPFATCLELSKTVSSSIPNVAKYVGELILAGFVTEGGRATSSGGRKPVTYHLVPSRFFLLAVAVDQSITTMCLVDLSNTIVSEIFTTDIALTADASSALMLTQRINEFLNKCGVNKSKILCAGVAMPGFVDIDKGINHSFMKVQEANLKNYLSSSIGLPVFIDNDSSAIALAELKFGAGNTYNELMVINVSWGIGLGMIINGEIFRGSKGFAGEFSHIPLFKNGKQCACGKYGCLETEASLLTITDQALEAILSGQTTSIRLNADKTVTTDAVFEAARRGDQVAVKLISDAAYVIGRGIAVLIHIMNPDVIVLSGRGVEAGKVWLAPIQQAINEYCIPTLTEETEVIISGIGKNAQLIGAAALAIENVTTEFFNSTMQKNQHVRLYSDKKNLKLNK